MTTITKTQSKNFDHFKRAGKKMGETKIRMLNPAHLQQQGLGPRVHKKDGETARESLCRQAQGRRKCGMGAAMSIISTTKHVEPRYAEGHALLKMFHQVTQGDKPPTATRNTVTYCPSCQMSLPADQVYRVSESNYKCQRCINKINKAHQLRHKERQRGNY